jgi:hypothetical protein
MTTSPKVLVSTLAGAIFLCLLGVPACRKVGTTGPSRSGHPSAVGFRCLEKRRGEVSLTSAEAHFVTWDGRLALLVLCDFSGGRTGGSGGEGRSFQRFYGYSESTTGRRVEWSWETVDGTSGTVVINCQKYDRSGGGLFLVHTKGGKVRVVQRRREFEGDKKALAQLAATDPNIEPFVAGAAEGRPGGF